MAKRLDLVGKKFGKLLVIEYVYTKNKRAHWLCKCNCGNEKIILGASLTIGRTKSCGCLLRLDLTGRRFGKLVVIKYVGNNKWRGSKWLCECDCGIEKVVVRSSLIGGHTKSCGCYHRERTSKRNKGRIGEKNPSYKHGLKGTKAYDNQKNAKRKALKKNQTPANADITKIRLIYNFCDKLNKAGFLKYEVDHIYPISKGGLHHQDNLQILKADLNHKKNARITDEYQGITLKDLS